MCQALNVMLCIVSSPASCHAASLPASPASVPSLSKDAGKGEIVKIFVGSYQLQLPKATRRADSGAFGPGCIPGADLLQRFF
mmetsp:Transcript_42890/g.80004  ORF Transcript_42890/g.80004 Transcript_42890/m.80004 type:complete len:82 (-) Transcript_42890:60-305(-)